MNFIIPIFRTIFRHRWFIFIGTVFVGCLLYYLNLNKTGGYSVKATLYTGVASGYSLEREQRTDWAQVQNSMDNLISIIQAESTLKRVSLRLFARVMIYGNPQKENKLISPESYLYTYNHVANSKHGKEILALIDKSSEENTIKNLEKYMKPDSENYIYGLFYFNHIYYSSNILKTIEVQRRLSSDLLDINFTSSDPGIAFNTVSILMDEFVEEYRRIRYGETDKVITYFKHALDSIKVELGTEEDSLTRYNVKNRVINYLDETKEIAAINKEYELREQDAAFAYNSARAMLSELEKHMDSNAKQVITNMQFMDKVKTASVLTGKISEVESTSTNDAKNTTLGQDKKRLEAVRGELDKLADNYVGQKYTKEGVSRNNIITQWLDQTLLLEKAKSDLDIIQKAREELKERYVLYAPVGTTIKQKERSINFIERNYLSILQSYNEALLRKKNLEMTSATLKVLNEPTYPISPNPTSKKKIVLGGTVACFIFLIVLLIIIEFLDKTLRDATRARRLTKYKVIGAIPAFSRKYSAYNHIYKELATKELSNSTLRYLTKRTEQGIYIVNLLSISENAGKSEIGKALCELWGKRGLKVRLISYQTDFNIESESYLLSSCVNDFYHPQGEDILIVIYPPLSKSNVPQSLLMNANVNLLAAPADKGWKSMDEKFSEMLRSEVEETPICMCLTNTDRIAIEEFTGLLPPYTLLRRMTYKFSQLALTEKIQFWKSEKGQKAVEEDD